MASTSKPQALLIARKQTSSLLSIHKRSKNSRFPSIPQSLPFSRKAPPPHHLWTAPPPWPDPALRGRATTSMGCRAATHSFERRAFAWMFVTSSTVTEKKKRQGNTHDYWWLLTLIIDHWLLTVPVIIVIIVILYWYIYIDIIDDCCRKWQELVSTSPSFGKTW